MLRKTIFSLVFSLVPFALQAQETFTKYTAFGIELQQYPTGFLLGGRAEFGFKAHQGIDLRVGYNLVDHRDLGVHDNEEGGGFGFTLGYRYYFKPQNEGLFLGARTDLWFNTIDWEDNPGVSGTTKIVVLQPTMVGGYLFIVGEKWTIAPTLAFGWEINVVENGEPVGEGSILLWGIAAEYRFKK